MHPCEKESLKALPEAGSAQVEHSAAPHAAELYPYSSAQPAQRDLWVLKAQVWPSEQEDWIAVCSQKVRVRSSVGEN